jgi:hypothetical protein
MFRPTTALLKFWNLLVARLVPERCSVPVFVFVFVFVFVPDLPPLGEDDLDEVDLDEDFLSEVMVSGE